ncbi:MAG: DUF1893 domain-containing protein [Clostridia bacterium]|nr:DUF1893 domain-containing protein [Clostridia bacterium]MBN2882228.1 DUF1893 domain-containing protein [Clostridia bacterium]
MNKLIDQLKLILNQEELTCVITDGNGFFFKSSERGINPLYEFINGNHGPGPFYLADKIIGKAAALLCIKANIIEVYSMVVSTSAKVILNDNSIDCSFDQEVPHIMNRTQTGLCPMEGLSTGVKDPDVMLEKIGTWLRSMKSS